PPNSSRLSELSTDEDLELQNVDGETALQGAVVSGNIQSVMAMLAKNPGLLHLPDRYNCIPLLIAAYYSLLRQEKREMVQYLYDAMSNNDLDPSVFYDDPGRQIIFSDWGWFP
ncbi:hypothetical protein MKX03_003413, partial [Papaver bracteatum]